MDEVSRKTLAVMLIVAVLISVVGTWNVLNANPKVAFMGPSNDGANVGYNLADANAPSRITVDEGRSNIGVEVLR